MRLPFREFPFASEADLSVALAAVLTALVRRGLTREQAYALVQRNAMRAWDEGRPLGELLAGDPEVVEVLPPGELAALLDPSWYTRHVPELMERVESL